MRNRSTAKRLRHFLDESKTGATALRLGTNENSLPRVAEAATLGWRPQPRCGSAAGMPQVYRQESHRAKLLFLRASV